MPNVLPIWPIDSLGAKENHFSGKKMDALRITGRGINISFSIPLSIGVMYELLVYK